MKKRKDSKPMFSLKKGGNDGADDPIVREWRKINRHPCTVRMNLGTRLAALVATLDGVSPEDIAGDKVPEGFEDRIQTVGEYLERAGEIDPFETDLEEVQDLAGELRAGLLDGPENVVPIRTEPARNPHTQELLGRAWRIACREHQGTLWDRISLAVRLLFVGLTFEAQGRISSKSRHELLEGLHQTFCAWLFDNRAAMLTAAEADELESLQEPDAPVPA